MTPRVTVLTYEVAWLTGPPSVLPPRQELSLGDFDCVLEGTVLTATPRGAYPTEAEATAAMEPHLRAWELELELDRGYRVEFRLTGSHAVDAEPGQPKHFVVGIGEHLTMSDSLQVTAHTDLPSPTATYQPTPRVQQLVIRLRDLREGREKAASAAYAILTDIEHTFGSGDRGAAAQALNVSSKLLTTLSRLASGQHPTEGRKVAKADPLTDADLDWLRRAVPLLVRRAAAVESGATGLPQLTLADV